jgi:hypothetical protein
MAHFAKIGLNNQVIYVTFVEDKYCLNAAGIEDEEIGVQHLERLHGWPLWKKCSWGTSGNKHYTLNTQTGIRELSEDQSKVYRGNFPGIKFIWDEDRQIFYRKKENESDVWDNNLCSFVYCVPRPSTNSYLNNFPNVDLMLTWNEGLVTWQGFEKSNPTNNYTWNKNLNVWQ